MLTRARFCRLAVPLGLAMLGACGHAAAPAAEHTTTTTTTPPPPALPMHTCTPQLPRGFELALAGDPALVHVGDWNGTCVATPMHDPPLEWLILVNLAQRSDPPRIGEDSGVEAIDRGTMTLLGAERPWIATRDEAPGVGPAEMRTLRVSLTHHDLNLVIAIANGAPESARALAMSTASSLQLRAAVPTDAVVYDAERPICRGLDGDRSPALTLTVPAGARIEPTMVGACGIFVGSDIDHFDWALSVGPVPAGDDWSVLRDSEDGARRALVGDPPRASITSEGVITWLGVPSHWYAADITEGSSTHVAAMTRVSAHGSVYYATILVTREHAADLPRVLAILETVRILE